ncbi:MAG: IS5/IS1182 family transposase, partial [Thermomicrobiales bacterium]
MPTEGRGIPVAVAATGANRHDMKKPEALPDAIVLAADPAEPPHPVLDRGCDYAACREAARERGYTPHIPPRAGAATPLPPPGDPDRHPPRRRVVEAARSRFNRLRRLPTRWEKRADCHLGFVQL